MLETRRATSASLPSPRRRPGPRPRLPHPRYDPPLPLDPAETPRPAAEEATAYPPAAAAPVPWDPLAEVAGDPPA